MRTIGAQFDDEHQAHAALAELRERGDGVLPGPTIAPLGTVEPGTGGAGHLLSGQFADDALPDVETTIARYGGHLVADRMVDGDAMP